MPISDYLRTKIPEILKENGRGMTNKQIFKRLQAFEAAVPYHSLSGVLRELLRKQILFRPRQGFWELADPENEGVSDTRED